MRHDNDCLSSMREVAQHVHDLKLVIGIEGRHRFVGQEERRVDG